MATDPALASSYDQFYVSTLRRLIQDGAIDPHAATLVVAGGGTDRDTLLACGFTEVTISNLADRSFYCPPYRWQRLDAEDIELPDSSFAQVIIHAGLHHCRSPHRALLEMVRVASKVALVFEARDSMLMRLAVRMGLAADFEHEAVAGGKCAGLRGTSVANYVYRWREREVIKTLSSYDPANVPRVRFFYGLRLPLDRLTGFHAPWKVRLLKMCALPVRGLFRLWRREGNEFAFVIML